jgi:hypothetical protein
LFCMSARRKKSVSVGPGISGVTVTPVSLVHGGGHIEG